MKFYTRRLVLLVVAVILSGLVGLANGTAETVGASGGGNVWEVYPTGDPALDVPNVQSAIDSASDGDTVILKAGTFDFGDWKTNPIPGGQVIIDKGITVKGDGYDESGNPKTIVKGGSYRHKNHWEHGERGVFVFGGDASGGVLEGIWLKEPHFLAISCNGSYGQNHENITIRNVKTTDISHDIPNWNHSLSVGRSMSLGFNVPEMGLRGPQGTVTIEGCDISHMGSTVDLDYIDPDTGTPYFRDPDGNALMEHDSRGINAFISTSASFVIRNNKVAAQSAGIVTEAMGGTGNVVVANNDIYVEAIAMPKLVSRRGYQLDAWPPWFPPVPFARAVLIEHNAIRIVGNPSEGVFVAGMLMGTDSGMPSYDGDVVVKGNEIEMQGGEGGLVMGFSRPWLNIMRGAEIRNNRLRGTAKYGLLALEGAQYCDIFGNNLATFAPGVAHIGLYGPNTHDNVIRGYSGVVDEADGAYDNYITGYAPMSPHAAKPNVPPIQ